MFIVFSNMLLNESNMIKLADLGISKLMKGNNRCTYFRTQQYMSPELFKAQFIDLKYYPNTDIWYENFAFAYIEKNLNLHITSLLLKKVSWLCAL